MGRNSSGTMAGILSAARREIDHTLLLMFPDETNFKFATAPLVIGADEYTNDLETVSEIRQTLEAPIDRMQIGIQNKDRVLGLHVAEHWQKWRTAEAVIGRYYQDGDGLGLSEWVEMFRGAVQQPNASDTQVKFDVIPDTVAPGGIVCNRTLALLCGFVFKDALTCAYAGTETLCDHHLKSKGGCEGLDNTEHFGGMESRYNPDADVPGTGGNPTGGGGGTGFPCPRLDQFVLVRGDGDKPMPKMVCFFTDEDKLFNPITRTFHKTRSAVIVRDQPIFETVAQNGAVSFSSDSHRILPFREHTNGMTVKDFYAGDAVLTYIENLTDSKIVLARPTGERGDVMKIEMLDGHIYCSGDSEEKFIVAHNNKPVEIPT